MARKRSAKYKPETHVTGSQKTPKKKKLKPSSARWVERQLKDAYVKLANQDGYRSRAAYKLIELDDKFRIFRIGQNIVDLGAAPGSWTQVAVSRVKSENQTEGRVISVDINPIVPIRGATILEMDFLAPTAKTAIIAQLLPKYADVVLSDMASPATGHRQTDALRVSGLCEAALDFATDALAPGGSFIAKVLKVGAEQGLVEKMRLKFKTVRHAKPPASRKESSESYVVAMDYRP